jgi:hypothetical protein
VRTFAPAALLLIVMGSAAENAFSPAMPALLYTVANRYEPLAWIAGGERFEGAATIFVREGDGRRALAPGFAKSADPTISFDGKTVLFAGKQRAGDQWQIWETALSDGDAKRMTSCPEGCVRPLYLPEQRIVYAEKMNGRFAIRATTAQGEALQLTYGPASSLPSDVLDDGRVLFQTSVPTGGKELSEIYTVYSDGSGVEAYRCDHGASRYSGKQIASGDIVYLSEGKLARFTSSRAQGVQVEAPRGEYAGDIAETKSGEWLVPWRKSTSGEFELVSWVPGLKTLRPALQESGSNVLQPVLITGRAVPKRHPSALHDWSYANLLCLNAYTSKYAFRAGSISAVKLYTKDDSGNAQSLGTSPVERDGSFFLQVPGNLPLQIELLDADGKTLKHEAGWFWLRGGEQRVCAGCHAGPETAPENAVPMVLLRSTTPADMTRPAEASTGGH